MKHTRESELTKCIVCDSIDIEPHGVHRDRRKGLTGSWGAFACRNCGLLMINPLPSTEELVKYYEAYTKNNDVDLEGKAGSRYPWLRRLFHKLSGDVDPRDFIDLPVGARVLDYGCGQAGYLVDFHARGMTISGAEIAPHLVNAYRDRGFDVAPVTDFSKIPFDANEFDVIYLMQVFEHLRDPNKFMEELSRVLKTGGTLYLAVPNAASIWRRVFRYSWVSGWFAPFHLFQYSRTTLEKIGARHGFVVLSSWTSTPESWFRLNLKALLFPNENRLDWRVSLLDLRPIRIVLMVILRIIELPFSERDCVVVKLRKRD